MLKAVKRQPFCYYTKMPAHRAVCYTKKPSFARAKLFNIIPRALKIFNPQTLKKNLIKWIAFQPNLSTALVSSRFLCGTVHSEEILHINYTYDNVAVCPKCLTYVKMSTLERLINVFKIIARQQFCAACYIYSEQTRYTTHSQQGIALLRQWLGDWAFFTTSQPLLYRLLPQWKPRCLKKHNSQHKDNKPWLGLMLYL